MSADIYVKRIQLLKEAVPGLARIGLLISPVTAPSVDPRAIAAEAKRRLNVEVREVEVRAPEELDRAVRRAKEQGVQALYVWTQNPFVWGTKLSALAISHRLPSVRWFRESALAGGLLSYAPSLTHIAGRGQCTSTRFCEAPGRPTSPSSNQRSSSWSLIKTAKALGLTIPPALLQRADQVIE